MSNNRCRRKTCRRKKKTKNIHLSDNPFIHLHVHGIYSLLDGNNSSLELATRAKSLGMPALALTDHNHLAGVIEHRDACKKLDIEAIYGYEGYYTDDTSILSLANKQRLKWGIDNAVKHGIIIPDDCTEADKKELCKEYLYPTKCFHVLFLAKNNNGYKNLIKLQSESSRLCTYKGRYLADNNLLKKYSKDVIMTTACIGSRTAQFIKHHKLDKAEALIKEWHAIYGEDFYLEVQPLTDELQFVTNLFYMRMHLKYGIALVATNDVHYTTFDEIDDHDTIICLGTGTIKNELNRMRYASEFWLRTKEEMVEAFELQYEIFKDILEDYQDFNDNEYLEYCYQAIEEPYNIYKKITFDVNLSTTESLFPKVNVSDKTTPEKYLRQLCYKGLYKYYTKHPEIDLKAYEQRLNYEITIINNKNFAPYMLVNHELVDWCKSNLIPTGPGRGSAAGSLILFTLGITKIIDPIKYQLLFSRFMTPDRTSMPDIDGDYSYEQRGEVIEHLKDTYGAYNISHIGTITAIGVKSGIKDFGRVLDYDFEELNTLTKTIDAIMDFTPSIKMKNLDALEKSTLEKDKKNYATFLKLEEKYADIFRLVRKYEGTPRNLGKHASGILIMPMPISDVFPVRYVDGVQTALFTGVQLDAFNTLKLDILGLKTLDIINNTIQSIDPKKTIYDFYNNETLPLYNTPYFKMICKLQTEGIFQIESSLFKSIIKSMQPHTIDDITALTSLARPGPLSAKMDKIYNMRKNGLEEWNEPLPNTLDLVEDTYGTIIYQEQIMKIAQRVAKFDDNQVDTYLRKSVSKKKTELLELCKQWFVYGKINAEPPKTYDSTNTNQVMYDPNAQYGSPICGGINDGYNKDDLITFFDSLRGYSSYLFNKSHAATYSYLTCLCAYLAKNHFKEFFAQVLSFKEAADIDRYIYYCIINGVKILLPDINTSKKGFSVENGAIRFGLNSIASVNKGIDAIIAHRPFASLDDFIGRVPKKLVNKAALTNLIKAGCFDYDLSNRVALLNDMAQIRRDKKNPWKEYAYSSAICSQFESESLKTVISYPSKIKTLRNAKNVSFNGFINTISEHTDRSGKLMAFFTLKIVENEGYTSECPGLCFSKNYGKYKIGLKTNTHYNFFGNIDDKGTFIVNKINRAK